MRYANIIVALCIASLLFALYGAVYLHAPLKGLEYRVMAAERALARHEAAIDRDFMWLSEKEANLARMEESMRNARREVLEIRADVKTLIRNGGGGHESGK